MEKKPELLVIGLGYVGLALAAEASRSGLTVIGFDTNTAVASQLNSGRSHIPDVSSDDISNILAHGFSAVSDEGQIGSPGTMVICVPTPLTVDCNPDLSAVTSAAGTVARILRPGGLVVLESTTYPGTTDEVVRPILEKGSGLNVGLDFSLAYSPERIDPGNQCYGIRNTPKVVGGITPACTQAAAAFYERICDQVVRTTSAREAELAKLLENTYRYINIALVNEMTILCRELNLDLWEAIRCATTKPFGFQPFYPGPGIGGHCIPIDPNYLSHKARAHGFPFRFIELAKEINSRMPSYVLARAAELLNQGKKPLNGSRVLLLGITYKKDSTDLRESPATPIAQMLRTAGAHVSFADPLADSWIVDGEPVPRADASAATIGTADLVIILQAHSVYQIGEIERSARLLLDTCGVTAAGERL
jgi:nucleotide sugar dehydrogenase